MSTPTLSILTQKVSAPGGLSDVDCTWAAQLLVSPGEPIADKKSFLKTLTARGETLTEIVSFASAFRDMAIDPRLGPLSARALDIVGTGGDRWGTYNISTTSAMLCAAAGVPVIKHGARSVFTRSGSADFIEALGIPLHADLDAIRRSFEHTGFCFLFAQSFHPAFKEIAPARKALAEEGSQSLLFNLIGPLMNPARPGAQLLGVFNTHWVAPMARALDRLGYARGLVVHSRITDARGMDELTCCGANFAQGCGALGSVDGIPDIQDLGLAPAPVSELIGGSPQENLRTLDALMDGKAARGLTDTLLLNAGAGIWTAGQAPDLRAGIEKARATLQGGTFKSWLEKARRDLCGK